MKKLLQSLFVLVFFAISAMAQQRTISGTVTGKEDGLPVPGVSVKIRGAQGGTSTGSDGRYSVVVPSGATGLDFSSIGFTTQTVNLTTNNVINVSLTPDSKMLGEVVVTALGVSRERRTLGYSATTVNSAEINRTSPVSIFDGLQGKVAGANITSQSGSPGASTKVILRGYSSITGNNQPLYVVDGVPIDNGTFGSSSINRSTDFGNNANDINPNDIESINILKGAGASSLYGSRAANGVILITTKKGKAGKVNVDFNSSATYSSLLMLPEFQNEFGQGWSGNFSFIENGSWGPRLTGENRLWGNVVDNKQLVKPFSAQKNNVKDFYDIGNEFNNSIALSGGNERSTFYFSYANVTSDGIIPTDADSYKRNTFSLRASTKVNNFTASGSLNYVSRNSSFVATGQGTSAGATLFQELIQIPRDHSIVDQKDYNNKYNNTNNYFTPYAQNPYFVVNENGNNFNSERIFGNVDLGYKINDWLSSTVRVGTDITNSRLKDWQAISKPDVGSPNITRAADVGGLVEQSIFRRELNADALLNFNKKISSDFTFDGLIGGNFNQRDSRGLTASIQGLTIPEFYELSNSSASPTAVTNYSTRRLFGAYGQANFGYNNYLFLSLNARNDWSSTLPAGNNSYFYPAANLSFVLSDAVSGLEKVGISFAKFRASYGMTGNDASPYLTESLLTAGDVLLGFGNIKFPLNGVSGFEIANQLGNGKLKPELTSEFEVGADVRFFNNRLGFDLAYYNKNTKDQILPVTTAATSGYTSLITNFGKVQNKGFEASVTGTPIKTSNFAWDLTYVYSKNRNKVLELPLGLEQVVINSGYDVDFVATVGQPLGVYRGPGEKLDPSGNIIVNPSNGLPLQADDKVVYGNSQRDFVMGLTNKFTYKNLALGFSFDYRKGGQFWSYTSQLNYFVGNAKRTLYNDRNPYIIPGSVNESVDANGNPVYSENKTPISIASVATNWSNGDNTQFVSRNTVLDKTSLKMRDITLSYTLPKLVSSKIKASNVTLTAYGRNLFIWLPSSNTFVDPEVSTYNNDLSGELGEFAGGPSTRSYGLSLKATF
jgi:TonB-linked SusC/RagA family outer membrane protein